MPRTKKVCGVPLETDLFYPNHLDSNTKGNYFFKAIRWPQDIPKQHCLTLVRSFEWPQFPKLPLLRCQNFLKVFSPSAFRWVPPVGLGPWGHNFPRPNTAALRSRERPRVGRAAAHRGQGGGGCEDQIRPWPRTKDLGMGKPPEAM